jgi:hypothetical protein
MRRMSAKPKDLFLGVMDLFAILLPGAVLGFFFVDLVEQPLLGDHPSHVTEWVAFVVASYVLGHFLSLLGSYVLDALYDKLKGRFFEPERRESLFKRSLVELKKLDIVDDSALKWAISVIAVSRPELMPDLERKEADQKLFRSLAIAFTAATVRFAVAGRWHFVAAGAILIWLSLWRYMNARVKYTNLANWHFISLVKCQKAGLLSESPERVIAAEE